MEPLLGRRLFFAQRAQHDFLDARLARHGASLWHWVLLRAASQADGASQREVAERMAVEPPTLVGHLDKLVDEGFVERRRDRRDRRITRVFLTAAGERRLVELHRVMTAAEREYRSILSPDELEWLGDALSRISEHFRGLKEKEEARGR